MQQNQAQIICDTNIWYRLADGRIAPQDVVGKQLVGTFMNAYEFCGTHNAVHNYALFHSAVKKFKECKVVIKEDPTEYIKMISGHKSIIPQWAKMDDALSNVVKTPNYVPQNEDRQRYDAHTQQIAAVLNPFLDVVNQHRAQIVNKGLHKRQMNSPAIRQAHKEITKRVITALSKGLALDWDRLELFTCTFDEWNRQLSIQPNLTMTANDWNDLIALAYVQPGSLYWTYDNKKTKGFIEQIGLGHYLYNL